MSFPDEDLDDATPETDDADITGDGDQEYGLAAALKALGQTTTDDDQEEETDDDEEPKSEPRPRAKEPPKPSPGEKRKVGDVIREKRKENKQLRGEMATLKAQLAELQAGASKGGSLEQLQVEFQKNPLGVLKQLGANNAELLDLMTKRSLAKGKVGDEVLEAIEEARKDAAEARKEAAELRKQQEEREAQAASQRGIQAFVSECADLKKYPEFEDYSEEDLLLGAQGLIQQAAARGINHIPAAEVARRLHVALAKAHEAAAARRTKAAPPAARRREVPELEPVEAGKSRGGKVREPTFAEIEKRVAGVFRKARLILPCWSRRASTFPAASLRRPSRR